MSLTARPKKPTHYKKRQAHHHRQSKRYIKPYLPYLPLLGLIGVMLFVNLKWREPQVLGANTDFSAAKLLDLTNSTRTARHTGTLQLDPQLTAAAEAKADDMVSENYWAHNSPAGKNPWQFISSAGYQFQAAGENLAYGFDSADQVINGWMNSPDHRANLLNSDYKQVGFGVASAPDYLGNGPATIVVAEYAEPSNTVTNISFKVRNTTDPSINNVNDSQLDLASRRVSRIQLMTRGKATWSLFASLSIATISAGFLLFRYGFKVQRALSRGEAFIAHHPWFDFILLVLAAAGYFFSRTAGFVR